MPSSIWAVNEQVEVLNTDAVKQLYEEQKAPRSMKSRRKCARVVDSKETRNELLSCI